MQTTSKWAGAIVAACLSAFTGHAMAQEKLTVWWVKGDQVHLFDVKTRLVCRA